MPAKISTLKDKVIKFYVICRNHKLSFIRMLGRDPKHLCSIGAPPSTLFLGVFLPTPASNSLGPWVAPCVKHHCRWSPEHGLAQGCPADRSPTDRIWSQSYQVPPHQWSSQFLQEGKNVSNELWGVLCPGESDCLKKRGRCYTSSVSLILTRSISVGPSNRKNKEEWAPRLRNCCQE